MKKTIGILLAVIGCVSAFGCRTTPEGEVRVVLPDGAPALALSRCLAEDTETDGVTYSVVDTSKEMKTLLSRLTNKDETKNADFCVLPVTAGAKLLGAGDRYKALGIVTQGNLYLVASSSETVYTDDVSRLLGKTVQVAKINEVPGLTLKAVLNRKGISWQVLDGAEASGDKVNLTTATFAPDVELLAEPAVSKRVASGKGFVVGDLQKMYGGEGGYPQAILVGKSSFLEQYPDFTEDFLAKVKGVGAWIKTASAEAVFTAITSHYVDAHTPAFGVENLGAETVARCGIRFDGGESAKTRIETYLTEVGFALPSASFYWGV